MHDSLTKHAAQLARLAMMIRIGLESAESAIPGINDLLAELATLGVTDFQVEGPAIYCRPAGPSSAYDDSFVVYQAAIIQPGGIGAVVWDATDSHGNMQDHVPLAKNVDQAMAALVTDLKQRGMLDETLVVWTTEFGRTPCHTEAGHKGREHHHQAFCSWMAGGGVKAGMSYGSTDDYGIAVVENQMHVHDFHATILHLLGLDHEKLTYRHAGRDYRLTDVAGEVAKAILA